jgi:hypothetical protein
VFFIAFGVAGLHAHKAGAFYHLSHTSSPFYSGYFGDVNYLPGLASNSDPHDLQEAGITGVGH